MVVDPRAERLERSLIRVRLMSFIGTRNRLNARLEDGASPRLSYL